MNSFNSPLLSNPSLNPSDNFVSFAPSQKEITRDFLPEIYRNVSANSQKMPVFFMEKKTSFKGNFQSFLTLEMIKSVLLLSFCWIFTVGLYGLVSNFNEGILGISRVYLRELAYFNVISAFFLILLLILIRRKTSGFVKEFRRKNAETCMKIENFTTWEKNFENKILVFLEKNGVFIKKICLLYDCSELLKLEKAKNEIEIQILMKNDVFLEKKLEELQEKSEILRNSEEFKKENFLGKMLVFFEEENGFFFEF